MNEVKAPKWEAFLARQREKQRTPFGKYTSQKGHAKHRGIEFNLTFEEWMDWWGDDFDKRGRGKDDLVMARIGDTGPYELGNIKKITFSENRREAYTNKS